MICQICHRPFYVETSFLNMFRFDKICPSCVQIIHTPYEIESIPIENGLVDLIVCLPNIFIPLELIDAYSMVYEKPLKLAIYSSTRYEIILFIDQNESDTFHLWFPLLKVFNSILFISLVQFDFSKNVRFF